MCRFHGSTSRPPTLRICIGFVLCATLCNAQSFSARITTGVLPGTGTDGAYQLSGVTDLGFDWWIPRTAGSVAFTVSLAAAGFVPEGEPFRRSVLLSPTGGVRTRLPLGNAGFALGGELSAGAYSRWTRLSNRDTVASRPVFRVLGDLTFLDVYGWESGMRAGYVLWYDESPIHSALIGIMVGRGW